VVWRSDHVIQRALFLLSVSRASWLGGWFAMARSDAASTKGKLVRWAVGTRQERFRFVSARLCAI